jgi:non-ribosomal peptide synthetase component F
MSRREGVTLFMTLLASFRFLLWSLTGQDDFVIGINTSGRDRIELESLIGMFINTLALRSQVSATESFDQLLRRTSQETIDARPISRAVRWLWRPSTWSENCRRGGP